MTRTSLEVICEGERTERRIAAGAPPCNGHALTVHEVLFDKHARTRNAILHIRNAPFPIEQSAITPPKPSTAAIVHIQYGEAAAGPVLYLRLIGTTGQPGRPSMTFDNQRRQFIADRTKAFVHRRIVEPMRHLVIGGLEDDRLRN